MTPRRRALQALRLALALFPIAAASFLHRTSLPQHGATTRSARTHCCYVLRGASRASSSSSSSSLSRSCGRCFVVSHSSPRQAKPGRREVAELRRSARSSSVEEERQGAEASSKQSELEQSSDNDIPPTNVTNLSLSSNAQGSDATLDTSDDKDDGVPSVAQILQFAVPAIGVWLCSPLLSLIDTSVVGLFSGTLQQAALNPAVAVTDYSARIFSFLYAGTTNMIATSRQRQLLVQQQQQQQDEDEDSNVTSSSLSSSMLVERTFVGALRMAILVGSGLGIALLGLAPQLTAGLIGNSQLDPEVARAATRYVRIRALGMPAAALIGTSQAACLGLKDVKSPLRVIVVAAIVNLVSDLALVGQKNPWIGGAAGAAWATSFSQYFAMALFWKWLTHSAPTQANPTSSNVSSTFESESDVPPPKPGRFMMVSRLVRSIRPRRRPRPESFSTRGLLAGHLSRQSLFQRPSHETTSGYRPYVVPVTTTQVGRCSTYIAMGHVVSSSFGTISMAANQVITSIFYSLIPIADSLSLTMQSFLPGIVIREPTAGRAKALRKTILNLYKCAGIFGLALSAAVACIPFASRFFTTDPAVAALVASIVPILFVIFSLHGVFCGSEGLLLGQRDLTFLGRMYAVYFCVVPYLMLRIKSVAQRAAAGATSGGGTGPHPPTLRSVWSLFLAYQLFRISVWVGRVMWLQRRAEKHASDTQQPIPV